MIYADNAATTTTRMSPRALQVMTDTARNVWGNPSSLYELGQAAQETLMDARGRMARILGAEAKEIYFTSGGSEGDNQAIRSCVRLGAAKNKRHIVSTAFEHHAVLHTLKRLEKEGCEITYLPVHENGIVTAEEVKAAIRPDTCLVTIMFANNEIGTIQPIREIGAVCRAAKVPFHTDAVQAAGHIPIDVKEMNIDLLSLSAHKFHGPRGVGALYCRTGLPLYPLIEGGAQERNRRAGTELPDGPAPLPPHRGRRPGAQPPGGHGERGGHLRHGDGPGGHGGQHGPEQGLCERPQGQAHGRP